MFVYEKVDPILSIWYIEGKKKMKGGDLTVDLHVHLCHGNWFPFLSPIFCIGSQGHFILVGSIVSANVCLRWVNFPYFCPLKCGQV